MPRLTNQHYLESRKRLVSLWRADHVGFAELTPAEQWHLHDYFQPSKDLSDAEALLHRERITELRPRLPQAAGRALKQLSHYAERQRARSAVPATSGRKGRRRVVVKSVVRPEIDTDLMAKAIVDLARRLAEQDLAKDQDAA